MSALDLQLLSMLIDEKPPTVRELPKHLRRQYIANGVERHRKRIAEALQNGIVEPTAAHIRQALADAAIHIIVTDAAGKAEVLRVLESVFSTHTDVPASIEKRIKSRKIRTKFLKSAQIADGTDLSHR
ncbi:hypothetical protein [Pararhizobium arenae]|uniref:hypothetical protein n=1 Tax=Pararhizobium arenae TaxID=1856850 RepID=UPI00094A9D54|nr:hypothetical protein [Pararhizobium arenae]